nr:Dual specificity phosphatase domain containing protein [Haemonchus contortus]
MARPQPVHFENDEIIHNLKRKKVRAVFNLQEFGEHPSCGSGNLDGGFSYDPERLMRNDIFYYNFPLPDFEACTPARLVDIVTVMIYELTRGKVAVHCHAGHGRTGMVIAACLMLVRGMTPREAVDVVRQKRPGSVQSSDQVQALHSLRVLLINSASVLPTSPFRTISEYIEFTGRVLPKMDMRRYGKVPKPLYIGFIALLRKFFSSVVLRLQSHAENPWRFLFECKGPTDFIVTEEMLHLMSVDVTARGQAYYFRKVQRGINIINLEKYLMEEENIVELVSFIDYFMRTAFFQLTTTDKLTEFLAIAQSSEDKMIETAEMTSLVERKHARLAKDAKFNIMQ